ncbi:extracellular metallo proteinase MEP [Melanomma pulvis-pyrius CBS 109.77]|uniref:Extracellular metalloproteinase n=1 Tax=Melanomma pulvis-pyrius CBS 109.77 TaxID=1314802 RepID=A0A6A6WXH8_9PLEO|nr:extracellular metallo proteinase MEP [Melanomma pulvis-pyrius CBS 109.77]
MVIAFRTSLALPSVTAHPHARPHAPRGLKKRTVDVNGLRYSDVALGTEYVNAKVVGLDASLNSLVKRVDALDTATELVKTTVPGATFNVINDHYVGDNGVAHFNFKQTVNDLVVDNADFNVNIGRDGLVFSYGNSFFKGDIPSPEDLEKAEKADPAVAFKAAVEALSLPISCEQAIAEAKEGLETYSIKESTGVFGEPEARLVYLQTADGKLSLTWRVETNILTNWLLTYVDAETGEKVHAVVDYTAAATYQVFPWGFADPTETSRAILTDPFDLSSSEFGWQSNGVENFTVTEGNNGIAQINPSGMDDYLDNPRPNAPDLKFEYPFSLNETNYEAYANASVTQVFYTANVYHDVLYKLGFIEKAGNFEFNNNGGGGVGNDFVVLQAQDGSATDNAFFTTPPDGQPGVMQMGITTGSVPMRDTAFDAGIIIHEYTHGVSTRLTGGPANSNCLNTVEAGGMGEGWGDFMATAIRLKPADTRATNYAMAAWAFADPAGIRRYLYSTDLTTNPHVYTDVNAIAPSADVHAIGTVWATMLYEVLWNLIDKHGKNDAGTPDLENGVPTDGKFLAMKLVIDGMALQPCNPNFVTARDAILDADKALTDGENACEIWTAFAKRGLGEGAIFASRTRTGSFVVPAGVC